MTYFQLRHRTIFLFHLWVEGDAPDEHHREDKRKILFDVEVEKTSFGEALFS